jgi:hypothetical protein
MAINVGGVIGAIAGKDYTPNFNITKNAGGGIPFVSRGNGSTGIAPAQPATNTGSQQGGVTLATQPAPTPPPSGNVDPNSLATAQAAQDKNNALFGIDSGLTSANDAMGRLGQQEQIGNGNIDNEYQAAINQLMGSNAVAQRNYDTSRTGQVNDYLAKQSDNAMQGRTWLDSARRTLGAQGAGSGSAARYNLPYEAQQQIAQGNATAQATNNKNLVALDTNWADTEDKFKNAQADVARQRDQGHNDLQSKIADQKATLLSTIAQLTGQKTIANGGDYKAAQAAAQGYTSQIPALLDRINSLSATPHIQAQQVTTTAPTLADYNYARPQAAPTPTQDVSLTNPILAAILGGAGQQDQNQLQYA